VHPHVIALPFFITVAGLALAVLAGALGRAGGQPPRPAILDLRWVALALVVGALGFLNAWDLPTAGLLVLVAFGLWSWSRTSRAPFRLDTSDAIVAGLAAAGLVVVAWRAAPLAIHAWEAGMAALTGVPAEPAATPVWLRVVGVAAAAALAYMVVGGLVRRAERGDGTSSWLLECLRFAAVLMGACLLLYLPFYLGLQSQVRGVGLVTDRSRLSQWLVHMGVPTYFAATTVVCGALWIRPASVARSGMRLAILAACGAVAAVSLLRAEWTGFLLASLVAASTLGALDVWAGADRLPAEDNAGERAALTFALSAAAIGFALPLGLEFVFVRDLFGTRMNSIFKFYYQAWILLGLAGAYAPVALVRRFRAVGPALTGRALLAAWSVPAIALVAAALIYPLAATQTRMAEDGDKPLTLDGLAWWNDAHPADRDMAAYLRDHAVGDAVIVEAVAGSYGHNGRISMATGLPAVLGWDFHETQWGREQEAIDQRKEDVERIYKSTSPDELLRLLAKYEVRYLIVGDMERAQYGLGAADIDRYSRALHLAQSWGQSMIFEVPTQVAGGTP
jgi:YYY domain-containing protein